MTRWKILMVSFMVVGLTHAFKRSPETPQRNEEEKEEFETEEEDVPVDVDPSDGEWCMTEDCVVSSASIIQNMDKGVRPCDNFAKFACGGYYQNTEIERGQASASVLKTLQKNTIFRMKTLLKTLDVEDGTDEMILNFFKSCMDVESISHYSYSPLIDIFKKLNLPLATFLNEENSPGLISHDPSKALIALTANTGEQGFFALGIVPDPNNPKENSFLSINPPTPIVRFNEGSVNEEFQEFAAIIFDVAEEMNDYLDTKGYHVIDANHVGKNVESYLRVEAELDFGITKRKENEDFEFKTVAELSERIEDLNKNLRSRSLPDREKIDVFSIIKIALLGLNNHQFDLNQTVVINSPNYFDNMLRVLPTLTDFEILNYISLRLFLLYSKVTPRSAKLWDQLEQRISGSGVSQDREDYCYNKAHGFFSAKISQLYQKYHHGKETKNETYEIIENLKQAFERRLDDAEWMDEQSRMKAKEKLEAIRVMDGFKKGFSNSSLVEVYKGLDEMHPDKYIENLFKLVQFWTKKSLSYLGMGAMAEDNPNNKDYNTLMINAQYNPIENAIWVPLGIQQGPLFKEGQPPYLNYGGLGFVAGHELTHGFDTTGSHYDKNGKKKTWWTKATLANYKQKQECFIHRYNEYYFKTLAVIPGYQGPTSDNGKQTLDEDIADNGGLANAFEAYNIYRSKNLDNLKKSTQKLPGLGQYTDLQLFFISFANTWCSQETARSLEFGLAYDPHSPAYVRILETLKNSWDFKDTFNCTDGDEMVNPQPCVL